MEDTEQTLLAALAERVGIAAEYHDISGVRHVTADHTKRDILRAMGFQVDSTAALAVGVPPMMPISAGSNAAAKKTADSRRIHLPGAW